MTLWLEICNYFIWAILLSVSIYGNVRLWSLKSQPFIQKRSVYAVFGLNATFIFLMIASITEQIATTRTSGKINQFAVLISGVITFIAFWILLFFLNTANWLLFYRIKWTYFTFKYKWQQIINKNATSMKNTNNFYISNNHKYGNKVFIRKFFGTYCCLACLICAIALSTIIILNSMAPVILILVTTFPAIISYTIIIWKIPQFADSFWMRDESKMHSKLLILFFILQPLVHASSEFTNSSEIVYLIGYPLIGSVLFLMNYTSTFTITKKNLDSIPLETESMADDKKIKLKDILSNPTAIQLFADHLSKEYSIECILSYIEFNQFQYYIKQNATELSENCNEIEIVVFPENVPVSSIIEQEDTFNVDVEDKFISSSKIKARKIFQKYVKNSAEFECNISYQQRNELYSLLDNVNVLLDSNVTENDLLLLYEPSKQEMRKLLLYSLTRFRATKDFDKVQSLFQQ